MLNLSEEIQSILLKDPAQVTAADKATMLKAMGENDMQAQILRTEFAQAQGALLLPLLQEESFVERIFTPFTYDGQPVPFPIRSRKVRSAWYSSGTDSVPMRTAEMKEASFNPFWLEAGAKWKLDYLKAGNVKLVDGLLADFISDLAYKVNLQGTAMFKWAEKAGDLASIARATSAPGAGMIFSLPIVQRLMTFVENRTQGRSAITDVFLSVNRYNEIIELAQFASAGATAEYSLPEQTRQAILAGGIKGVSSIFLSNFGITLHKVRRPEFVNDDKCYAFDARTFGVMPIQKRLETMAENVGASRFETGLIGRQRQGFGITDVDAAVVYYFSDTPHTNDPIYNDASASPAFEV